MLESITRGVKVEVESEYLEEESAPEDSQYYFAYHITITNVGDSTVQLISRHWVITDANGKTEEVKGPGVVGHQPTLGPGASFSYTSYCPLETPVGSMHGTYQMVDEDMETFDAVIVPFSLCVPGMLQ